MAVLRSENVAAADQLGRSVRRRYGGRRLLS
jgi:hypothetical protein